MKKHILPLLALILLFSLLLCSCAEGLPMSELYFTAQDKTADFSTRLEHLFAENKPIVANGKSDYSVVWTSGASASTVAAIHSLCERVERCTGVDLIANKKTATKRILVGVMNIESAKLAASALSQSEFYIGFADDDLIIQAKNEIMLVSALQYFMDTYLPEKDELYDLYLPNALSYTSSLKIYESGMYSIVRAENSGDRAAAAMNRLSEAFHEYAGVRVSTKSDFANAGNEKEILVGHPNRAECREILATLSYDQYYIGMSQGKLMILANNDIMLENAVDHFISTFITAEDADINKESKNIAIPAHCQFNYRASTVLLADQGVANAVIVHPKHMNQMTRDAITALQARFKQLTNTTLEAYVDEEYRRTEGVLEILIGNTNRTEAHKPLYQQLAPGQYVIDVSENKNAIVVAANGNFAMKFAIESLAASLTELTQAANSESIYDGWSIKENVNRLLFLSAEYFAIKNEAPDLPTIHSYRIAYSYYTMTQKNVDIAFYTQYIGYLKQADFTKQSESSANGVTTAVYRNNDRTVTVTYTAATQTLQARVSTRRQ